MLSIVISRRGSTVYGWVVQISNFEGKASCVDGRESRARARWKSVLREIVRNEDVCKIKVKKITRREEGEERV